MKKRIFITGGTRGIGKAIAKKFALNQDILFLNYLNNDIEANKTKQELEKEYNVQVNLIKADISKEEEVKKILDEINEPFDVIVNNAGIAIDTTLEDKTVLNFQQILNTNLIGPFLICKYLGGKMYERGIGKIINITSTNGIDTYYPESMDYDASKAGLISLTHNFAQLYAPIISVNAVACGWVETEMNQDMDLEYKRIEEEKILIKRFAKPEEIANVVYFLSTDEASYIQNTIIRVDGGKIN